MNYFGYIYLVIDLVNGKKYVGKHKAKQFDSRYYGNGRIIKHAVRKYGFDRFKIRPIDCAYSMEELNELEIKWIKNLDCISPKRI